MFIRPGGVPGNGDASLAPSEQSEHIPNSDFFCSHCQLQTGKVKQCKNEHATVASALKK